MDDQRDYAEEAANQREKESERNDPGYRLTDNRRHVFRKDGSRVYWTDDDYDHALDVLIGYGD